MADGLIKTNEEIDKMRAADLKLYAKEISSCFRELNNRLFDKDTGVIVKLQQQLEVSQAINKSLVRQLSEVERTSISNAQYARRETLELHGVPDSFDAAAGLENNVIKLLNDIAPDANIVASDVQAIHRLSRKRSHVIIKLISRRKKQQLIVKRAKLKEEGIKGRHAITAPIYLNESMCPQVAKLHYYCRQLKRNGKIHYYNFFNGNLRIQMEDGGERNLVGHISDLVRITGIPRNEIESA
jgi:hypothetical protein